MTDADLTALTRSADAQEFRAMREASEAEATVPPEVLQAVAFLRQRADAGDNVARAVLVCLRYVNTRLE